MSPVNPGIGGKGGRRGWGGTGGLGGVAVVITKLGTTNGFHLSLHQIEGSGGKESTNPPAERPELGLSGEPQGHQNIVALQHCRLLKCNLLQ